MSRFKGSARETESAEEVWRRTCSALADCRDCDHLGILHEKARPLFGRFRVSRGEVLFVFEAPNLDDTINPQKGYLTYDTATDPTGRFTHELFTQVLGIKSDSFQVTNAVLCLPARKDGKFPIDPKQIEMCSGNIRCQIKVLDPTVVVSIGRKALEALNEIDDYSFRNLNDVVCQPQRWFGRWLFPLAHTSQLGRVNRPEKKQRADWAVLKAFLESQGVQIGPTGT